MVCLSTISMMFVKNDVGSVYVGGYGCPSESGFCFLVVRERPSVLL